MKPERAKLLIVDDSRMIRRVLRGLLQGMGFQSIDEACDGVDALDLFEMTPYDLVLTDWNMQQLSGIELLRTVRSGSLRSHTPVLLISGDVSAQRVAEALASGANGFIPKPFVARELCEHVEKIIAVLPEAPTTRINEAIRAHL